MDLLTHIYLKLKQEDGVTAITIVLLLAILFGFSALALDIAHICLVRNELQNAADAGALAGARFLYNDDGSSVNTSSNQIAYEAAISNKSEDIPVEVHWSGDNSGDVERGHWSFSSGCFTPNSSTEPVELWGKSLMELDEDPNFINAVRVKTRRQNTPAASFFAGIFGFQNFSLSAEAVAYIGFAGSLAPFEVNEPIAICKEAIHINGRYRCDVGRMINSGSNPGHQTGGWTNFTQDPCETASAISIRPLVGKGNPVMIEIGKEMGTTGGMVETAYDLLLQRWLNDLNLDTDGDGFPDRFWQITLPVIECAGNNVSPCSNLVGAVNVNIVWITRTDKNQMREVPKKMENWSCPSGYTPEQCWESFVNHFQLKDVQSGTPVPYEDKTIYFLPDCSIHKPIGHSGGENFGILSKVPVLVK